MWFAQVLEFVRKQFRPYSIRWLDGIDAMFGILTPVVCLLIDPRVFTHGPTPSEPGLSGWRVFAFTAVGGGALALMSVWLTRGRSGWLMSMIAIPFGVGALGAVLIGWQTALLSVAALGLLVVAGLMGSPLIVVQTAPIAGLGLLGLTPQLTGIVYLRTAARAVAADPCGQGLFGTVKTTVAHILGIALLLGIPAGMQVWANDFVQTRVDAILQDPQPQPAVVAELKAAFWCTPACYWNIARQYEQANGDDRKRRLVDVYFELTGVILQPYIEQFQD